MKSIVIYQPITDYVNGTNTSLLNFLKTFCDDYKITIVCDFGVIDVLLEFSKYADVIMELKEEIKCDYLILNRYDVKDSTLKFIKTKTKPIQMIHCDFNSMVNLKENFDNLPNMNVDYICVSECSQKGLKDVFNKDSIVIPNIVSKPIQRKWLRICSATRLSDSKGYEEMCAFARLLKKYNIDYVWDVYTSSTIKDEERLFNFKKPIMNISEYYCNYDYIAQFSKSESFSYTMYEALSASIPVLVTPFPNAQLEIENGVNGYILPFDMKLNKSQINKIVTKIPKDFKYEQTGVKDLWIEILK